MTTVERIRSTAGTLAHEAAKRLLVQALSRLRSGHLQVTFPNGSTSTYGTPGTRPEAAIEILDNEFFGRMLTGGEIGFGEAYMDGLWRSPDIVALLELGLLNRGRVSLNIPGLGRVSRLADRRLHLRRKNTIDKARENVHAHYDLGNDFYRLFLDNTMTYSSAYFSNPEQPLAEAQHNKYFMLCEKAGVQRGDHLLEIGTGWGGFAIYVARSYGCHVTSITISKEQIEMAQRRVEGAGLGHLVDVQFADYREVTGSFDRVVSIEMLEAVGAEYFATFFHQIDSLLKPGGKAAIQVITVPERNFKSVRDGVNWIQKYIFPGGMLPSLAEVERALAGTGLVVTGVEDIGLHYATTLRRWRAAFMANLPAVMGLGFDERFIRMWEYYLTSSEACFLTRTTGDLQVVLEHQPG